MSEAFFHLPDSAPAPVGADSAHDSAQPLLTQQLIGDESCTGPWSPDVMHGGPPSALLVRACEQAAALSPADPSEHAAPLSALRASIDFLAPVPVGPLTVRSRVLRGGRRITLTEAELWARGRQVLHARTWLLRTDAGLDAGLDAAPPHAGPLAPTDRDGKNGPALPDPSACPPALTRWSFPYARALEWRRVSGDPDGPGDAAAWVRSRLPVLAGETPSGLQRAVLVADSGNGISAALDWARWSFVNVDLAVHLARPLRGEWVLLDAHSQYGRGSGLATSLLSDRTGPVGRAAQTLLVSARTDTGPLSGPGSREAGRTGSG